MYTINRYLRVGRARSRSSFSALLFLLLFAAALLHSTTSRFVAASSINTTAIGNYRTVLCYPIESNSEFDLSVPLCDPVPAEGVCDPFAESIAAGTDPITDAQYAVTVIKYVLIIVGAIVSGFLVTVLLCVQGCCLRKQSASESPLGRLFNKVLRQLDRFSMEHDAEEGHPVRKQTTFMGGAISIAFYLMFFILLAFSLAEVISNNNFSYNLSLIVEQFVQDVDDMTASGEYNVYMNFTGLSNVDCSSTGIYLDVQSWTFLGTTTRNNITSDTIKGSYKNGMVVSAKYHNNTDTCAISMKCSRCSFSGDNPTVTTTFMITNATTKYCVTAEQVVMQLEMPYYKNPKKTYITKKVAPAGSSVLANGKSSQTIKLTKAIYKPLSWDYFFYKVFTTATINDNDVGATLGRAPPRVGWSLYDIGVGDLAITEKIPANGIPCANVAQNQRVENNQNYGLSFTMDLEVNAAVLLIEVTSSMQLLGFLTQVSALAGVIGTATLFVYSRVDGAFGIAQKVQKRKRVGSATTGDSATAPEEDAELGETTADDKSVADGCDKRMQQLEQQLKLIQQQLQAKDGRMGTEPKMRSQTPGDDPTKTLYPIDYE